LRDFSSKELFYFPSSALELRWNGGRSGTEIKKTTA
jgi:hypothetical protein